MGWPGTTAKAPRPTLLPRLRKLWHLVQDGKGVGHETYCIALIALKLGSLEGAARELGKNPGNAHTLLRRLVAKLERVKARANPRDSFEPAKLTAGEFNEP